METIINWTGQNYLEIAGFLAALIYLYFSVKQDIWLWPWGILTSAAYIFIFFDSKFYADMGLQVYYLIISLYGWYYWALGKRPNNSDQLPVSRIKSKLIMILAIIFVVLFILITYILIEYTDSPLPYWDSFTTSLSVIATWMLAKKFIEHWLIWIVVDIISLGLYIYKDLHITAVLFIVYTGVAIIGYFTWRKTIKTTKVVL